MKLQVLDINNKVVGDVEVNDKVFGLDVVTDDGQKKMNNVVYEAIKNNLANKRQGTADTKTRGEINASTRKPWRQKGTGRARAGTRKSPLWTGGGVIFGPHPRDYSYKIHKKVRQKALFSVLSSFVNDKKLIVLDDFQQKEYKTKEMNNVFSAITNKKKVVFVINSDEKENYNKILKSSTNLPYVKTLNSKALDIKELFYADEIVFLKSSLLEINERYSK